LAILEKKVVACKRCPRLIAYCREVARIKRRAYLDWEYWGKPVPSFGDPDARLLIVGLAPGAHGANRTGRMFTGDRSGDWLYKVMYETGFASQPTSVSRDDGLQLYGARIAASAHCAPPDNKPTPDELRNCRSWLEGELDLFPDLRVVIALGRIAFDGYLSILKERGLIARRADYTFGHHRIHPLGEGLPVLISSYHPSQQNTSTGKLTEPMLTAVFLSAREIVDQNLAGASLLPGLAGAGRMAAAAKGLKIGVTDWNLQLTCKIEAVALAKELGFDGVQVSIGRTVTDNKMTMDDSALIAQYREESKKHKIPLDGTCLDRLHVDCLKSNNRDAAKRVSDGIRITHALGVQVMLMPFFGKCSTTPADYDSTADLLKELAPEAEKAGVILGLENTLSAEDNVRIMDKVKSPVVKVYYDVGNSTNNKYDVVKEIPWLGKDRICQIHLKDQGYLGEGKIDFEKVLAAIRSIGFDGFANLETNSPSKVIADDMRKNLAFVRGVLSQRAT
jgi:uracil-DNA glycosylase family 4